MSSFELKSPDPIYLGYAAENLVLSVPRNRLAVLLAGRGIDLSTWTKTYDKVLERYRFLLETAPKIPCFLLCRMSKMIAVHKEHHLAWIRLARDQNEIYRKFGVQVSLAKEVVRRDSNNEIVGLRFDMGSTPKATTFAVPLSPALEAMCQDNRGGVVDIQLKQLLSLHQQGVLTAAEYQQTKMRFLHTKQQYNFFEQARKQKKYSSV